MVSCRICKGDHWTTRCPYKDTLQPLQENLKEGEKKPEASAGSAGAGSAASKTGKYVPPSLRDGATKGRGESMNNSKRGQLFLFFLYGICSEITEAIFIHLAWIPFLSRLYFDNDLSLACHNGLVSLSSNHSLIAILSARQLYVFTQPLHHEQDVTQGQFLSGVKLEFSFPFKLVA